MGGNLSRSIAELMTAPQQLRGGRPERKFSHNRQEVPVTSFQHVNSLGLKVQRLVSGAAGRRKRYLTDVCQDSGGKVILQVDTREEGDQPQICI